MRCTLMCGKSSQMLSHAASPIYSKIAGDSLLKYLGECEASLVITVEGGRPDKIGTRLWVCANSSLDHSVLIPKRLHCHSWDQSRPF